MRRGVFLDPIEDGVDVMPFTRVKCVFGIAVLTAQRTSRQAHEHRAKPDRVGLPLQRMKDFIDAQPFVLRQFLTHSCAAQCYSASRLASPGQCFSTAILSRRCCAKCPAGASGYDEATCDNASFAACHC